MTAKGEKEVPLHPPASSSYRLLASLTDGLRQPVDPLPVGVCLVPDVRVGQIGRGVEPLLEEVALHRHHQVDLEQPHGHHSGRHGHLEQGAVTLRPGAEVAQLQAGAGHLDLLVQHLGDTKKEEKMTGEKD